MRIISFNLYFFNCSDNNNMLVILKMKILTTNIDNCFCEFNDFDIWRVTKFSKLKILV